MPDKALSLTVGNDAKVSMDLQRFGAHTVETKVDEIHVDTKNNIVSTPAFMLAETPLEAESGINKLVAKVIELAKAV